MPESGRSGSEASVGGLRGAGRGEQRGRGGEGDYPQILLVLRRLLQRAEGQEELREEVMELQPLRVLELAQEMFLGFGEQKVGGKELDEGV